jgi:DNA-binding NarL/FixJ family response regulator
MVAEVLAARLSAADDLWIIGRYPTDHPQLPDVVQGLRPDVVILEVEALGAGSAEMLCRLRAACRLAKMLVLTGSDDPQRAVEAARCGVDAWITKESSLDQLVAAIRGVCQGHAIYTPRHLGAVLRQLRDDVQQARDRSGPLDVLSSRERDVLACMVEGKAAPQIAGELLISANTVRTHMYNILAKLQVHSGLEAVSVARGAGMRPSSERPDGAAANLRIVRTT